MTAFSWASRHASGPTRIGPVQGAPRRGTPLWPGLMLCGLCALALAPNAWWLYQGQAVAPLVPALAANLVFMLVLLALCARVWVGALLLLPFAVLAPAEIFYIHTYGHPSDAHLLGILGETDINEAGNYVRGIGLAVLAACLLIALGGGLLVRALRRARLAWPARTRWLVLLGGGLAAAMLLLPSLPVDEAEAMALEPASQHSEADTMLVGSAPSAVSRELINSYPLGLPFRVAAYAEQRAGLDQAQRLLQEFSFGARQAVPQGARQVHILVIGETGRADRWQLNGYARPTTPRLARTPGVVSFTNAVSSWAWTRMSVPVMLTRKPGSDPNPFYAEKSLVAAFREAGFKTYWLSTQSPLGKHDSSIALHAHEADEVRFLNPVRYSGAGVLDGVLLPPLEAILQKNEPRQLIVLHTLGSHFNYADRYPPAFERFRPSLTGRADASLHDRSLKRELNNSYDNSIAYTDYFLSEVIRLAANTRSVASLLYMADHGENLFDGACEKSGHGHTTELDYRVASIWWNSPAFAAAQPEAVARLHARRQAAVASSHVFHTMLDAAGIAVRGGSDSASLLSADWAPGMRVVQGGLDFDRAAREPVCQVLKPATNRKIAKHER